MDTVRTSQTVVSDDVAADPRWPALGRQVAKEYGIGSVLSLLLYDGEDSYGALNLYTDRSHGFSTEDYVLAQSLAAHLAVAAAAGRRTDQLGAAIVSRTVIGQAEGILIERYKVTPDQAFDLLRRRSQHANRKVVSLAEELVSTGEWELDRPEPSPS